MTTISPKRLRADLSRLAHTGLGVRDFTLRSARAIDRAVPFDGVCMLTLDPATRLPTSEVVENGLPPEASPRIAEIEYTGHDVNSWDALARADRPAATLSEVTGGDLDRSRRHRELRSAKGFGDELRALAIGDSATWGALTLLRGADRPSFTREETVLVASISDELADGLRRATLLNALASGDASEGEAGLVLLEPDGSIAATDAAADRWLAELRAGGESAPIPGLVAAAAARARALVDRRSDDGPAAHARVRVESGVWLLVRASVLGDDPGAQVAVIIEPARAHDLAPLIADAYGLSERERAVTRLVAQGLQTNAIARQLHISPWTVQDHLKSIFEKVDVRSRGELIARLFFDRYAPRLAAGEPVGARGAFE